MKRNLLPEATSPRYAATKMRQDAEARMQKQTADAAPLSEQEVRKLLHELQVHQIELEMQNEELQQSQIIAENATTRYINLYNSNPTGLLTLTPNGSIRQINLAAALMLGRDREQLQEAHFNFFVAESNRLAFDDFLQQVFNSEGMEVCELLLTTENKTWVTEKTEEKQPAPCTVLVEATRSADAQECYMVLVDITKRKQIETRLKLDASVFFHSRDGIIITDHEGTIIEVNDAFTRISGYQKEECLHQNPRFLNSGRHTQKFYASMWASLQESGYWSGEIWDRHKSGEDFAVLLSISAIYDESNQLKNYVAIFTDITAMKKHQAQLEHIAHYDVLTSLPNRVLLADRLHLAMSQSNRRNQSLAVAYLDLDGFKKINDTHGHEKGDELLIVLSQRMKEALRDGDTLARIGGDEFVAVLIDVAKEDDYEPILSRLLQVTADPVTVDDLNLKVSASIGITLYPQDGAEDADQLMRHADQAMYVAKQMGKNRYHMFDVTLDAAIKTRRESIERIKLAMERSEFVLYYQPKVNMRSGEVIGAEALIRWQHPERSIIMPGDFLPIIENHTLSVTLGEWVIDTALTQIEEWQNAGLNIALSVNVSAQQLQEQNFTSKLSAALARHPGIKPASLQLEILETSALEDINEVSAIMQDCLDIGVSFALDDFGTGFSSLTYLKRLPADLLKIDQSFVRDMLDDPDDRAIVRGVISLAAAFNRQVIAEGVETIAHGTRLIAKGCVLAQGDGIAKPMPAAELPAWIAGWQPDAAWMG